MSLEFVARNGVIALNNSQVTGSLSVSNGITGNLTGTASYALTSSYSSNIAGTTNTVPKFTGASTIGNSSIQDLTTGVLVNNSVTASAGIARGTNLTPTLTAAANNDVLVGLDINPTFTNGAFTGVSNYALRVQGTTNTNFFSTGNVGINQSTDAGYKLDVNGTARVQSTLGVTGAATFSSSVTANGQIIGTASGASALNYQAYGQNNYVGYELKREVNNAATIGIYLESGTTNFAIGNKYLGGGNSLVISTTDGHTTIASTTAATNYTTGALVVSGGVGIAGKLFVNNEVHIANNTSLAFTNAAGSGNAFDIYADPSNNMIFRNGGAWNFNNGSSNVVTISNSGAATLAGALSGTSATFTPNTTGPSTGLTVVNGDITTYRSGGTSGVIFLSSSGGEYLYYDGSKYVLNNKPVNINVTTASTSYTTGALVVSGGVGIAGAVYTNGIIQTNNSNGNNVINLYNTSNSKTVQIENNSFGGVNFWTDGAYGYTWFSSATSRMTLSSGGNLSVVGSLSGTSASFATPSSSSAQTYLTLYGGNYSSTAYGANFRFGTSGWASANLNRGARFTINGSSNTEIQTTDGGGTDATDVSLKLQPSGGGTNIGGTLGVTGAATFSSSVTINGGNGLYLNNSSNSAVSEIYNAGGANIQFKQYGTTTFNFADNGVMSIYGTTASTSYTTGALVVSGGVGVAGAIYSNSTINAAGGFFETSDERLKKVIKHYATNHGFAAVDFIWKKTGVEDFGYIAQEVEKVIPFAVHTRVDGFKEVNYNKANLYKIMRLEDCLIKEHATIHKRIDELEAELKTLKERLK